MATRIFVAGHSGQVAQALRELSLPDGYELKAFGRPDFDLADPSAIERVLDAFQPDIVVNAGAYTAVDQAETDAEQAHAINEAGAGNLASLSAKRGVPVLHLSTDYVFDGSKASPYTEADPVRPLGVYGASKLAGERAVLEANPDSIVLRTAWVYSPFGKNFCRTMLRLAGDREEVSVVDDQIGNPTYAIDIADAILTIIHRIRSGEVPLKPGTYHLSGNGRASWADFAEAIFESSKALGGPSASVRRIPSSEFPTPVTRPANSQLDCTRLEKDYGVSMPSWRESCRDCVERLIQTGAISS